MPRYIDVDKAIESIRNGDGTSMQKLFAECCLLTVPAADVVPKSEVAREIFAEIEKIIQKNYDSAQNNEEDEELEAATDYLSYVSYDIDKLKEKYEVNRE